MDTKITAFRTLLFLIDLDPKEHIIKEMARLLIGAVIDWPTDTRDFVQSTKEFKKFFGSPLTIDGIKNAHFPPNLSLWAWRLEAGSQLTEILKMSIDHDNTANFDMIIGNILTWYKKIYSTVDFIAEVNYFTVVHGGRQTPIRSGFQTHLKFDGQEKLTAAKQTLLDTEMFLPGELATVKMKLLSPDFFVNTLYKGKRFSCLEGSTIIGTGRIRQVVNQRLETQYWHFNEIM